MSAYFTVYPLSPGLNAMARQFSKKQWFSVILCLLLLESHSFAPGTSSWWSFDHGRGPQHFCLMYLLSSCFGIYRASLPGLLDLFSFAVLCGWQTHWRIGRKTIFLPRLHKTLWPTLIYGDREPYGSLGSILLSLALFSLVQRIAITGPLGASLSLAGRMSSAVYLIQEQGELSQVLYRNILRIDIRSLHDRQRYALHWHHTMNMTIAAMTVEMIRGFFVGMGLSFMNWLLFMLYQIWRSRSSEATQVMDKEAH
jgi:hypothetical protein